jgi:hypothetical protein
MGTQTVGFTVTDADRAELDELVAHFSGGNRSAYLRATIGIMRSVIASVGVARRSRHTASSDWRSREPLCDVTAITRRVLEGRE